ncbi:excalibur calcium-binding domain-containing protein [Blastococcus sp. SYSU D00820]
MRQVGRCRAPPAPAAPIHRGDPGYSTKLDRDGDGIGCEN